MTRVRNKDTNEAVKVEYTRHISAGRQLESRLQLSIPDQCNQGTGQLPENWDARLPVYYDKIAER